MINPETFIQDFRKLFLESPQCGSWTRASENCDYGDIIVVSKDCYMCFNSGNCQNAYYSEDSRALKDCVDCAYCENCELAYECVDCDTCYNSNYCQDCSNCNDIQFCYDLRRCKNCIGCVGLRDKEFYIFNEPYSKDDYEEAIKQFDLENDGMIDLINDKVSELQKKVPRMFAHQFDAHNSTGDYIYHSKNCHMCFDTRHTEDSGYIIQANLDIGTKDSWDCGPAPTGMDLCYDISYAHYLFNCRHIYWSGNLKDSEYCTNCFESEHLFGCQYLKNKQKKFYILNQEVEEDYYWKTTAQIKEYLIKQGIYSIYDLVFKDLSTPILTISDAETKRNCQICGENFELCENEITFYKKNNILFPVYCPPCRAKQREKWRNDRDVFKRKCDSCKNVLITTFPADSPYTVYCLDCYMKNIN